MKREAKQIVDCIASAVAAASMYNPEELRQAATYICTRSFSADDDDREVIIAFAALLKKRSERKERVLRETYSRPRGQPSKKVRS